MRQIALVALDRQVSRRVWALLRRVGVDIQDDTGWLLSTSRAASAWFHGLQLLHEAVLAKDLMQWLTHPIVLADWPSERKAAALAVLACLGRSAAALSADARVAHMGRLAEEWAYVKMRAMPLADLSAAEMDTAYADVHELLAQAKISTAVGKRRARCRCGRKS